MKKNMLHISCFLLLASCFILATSCKDSGSGGAPPPSGQDKIVWSEAENIVFNTGQSLKSQKALPEAGMFKGLYKGPDDESQSPSQGSGSKTFYVKSLIDDKVTQLTPNISYGSNVQKLGLAPNGDFWFGTDYGLFVVNVNSESPRPVMVIASQKAATGFIETSVDGVYKADLSDAYVKFVSDPSNSGHYFAFIKYLVTADTSAEEGSASYSVVLKYDSADASLKPLFPFSFDNSESESDKISVSLSSSGDEVILGGSGLYYILSVAKTGMKSFFLVRYDPFSDKHYLQFGKQSEFSSSFSSAGTCKLTSGKCRTAKPLLVDVAKCDAVIDQNSPKETATSNAQKSVMDCVNAELGKQKVQVTDVSFINKDITDYLASKDEVKKIGDAGMGESAQLFSIDANKLKNTYSEIYGYSSISCDTAKCFYKEPWIKDEKKALVNISSLSGHFGKSAFYFKGYSGSSQALYKANYSDGAITTIIETSAYSYPNFFEESDGNIIISYSEYSDGKSNIVNLYFESAGKLFPIVSSKLLTFDSFIDMSDGRPIESNGIVKDGSKAIVQAKEAEGDFKKYWFNLSDVQSGKELTLNPMISDTYSSADLKMIWKGYAFWQDSTNGLIVNRPFDENKNEKVIKSIKGINLDFLAGTVGAFKPPAELGLDISADFGNVFKCGAGGEFALWCEGEDEMCEAGKCVAKKFTECSAHADCKKYGYCVDGKCAAKYCNVGEYNTCLPGSACNPETSYCKGLAHADECADDTQCGYNSGQVCLNDTAKGYKICQDKKEACAANSQCVLGYKCTGGYCEVLAHTDECVDDGQCNEGLVCLDDAAKKYKTCQEKKVAGSCATNADCGTGFICGSAKMCLPVMKDLTVTNESGNSPIVKTDEMLFDAKASWTIVKDFSGQDIQKYFFMVKNVVTGAETIVKQEVIKNTINFYASVPGNKGSYAYLTTVWPSIEGVTDADIGKIKKSKTLPLNNTTHCMLTKANTNSCPVNGICKQNICECTPTCQGKVCGSDGCDSQCGKCAPGDSCNANGQCVDNE